MKRSDTCGMRCLKCSSPWDYVPEGQMEATVRKMLNGWVDSGGFWSPDAENAVASSCQCLRLPKMLIPREKFAHFGKGWAARLIERLGLNS